MTIVTRRTLLLALSSVPLTCLGCGDGAATINTEVAQKRTQRIENLKEKAALKRESKTAKSPAK